MNDPILLAYLAGALDADGSFTIIRNASYQRGGRTRHPQYQEHIGYTQAIKRRLVADLLKATFGGNLYVQRARAYSHNGQSIIRWKVTNKAAANAAAHLLPYLRLKKRQAGLLVALSKHKSWPKSKLLTRTGERRLLSNAIGTHMISTVVVSDGALHYRIALYERVRLLNQCGHDPLVVKPKRPRLF